MAHMTTPITRERWHALKVGDELRDSRCRIWEIVEICLRGTHDILLAECPGYDAGELVWRDGEIQDNEGGSVMELNHPDAGIVN